MSALALAGCGDVSRLSDLGKALNAEFAPIPVGVALADQIILTVTVADSALAQAPCEAQVAFALRVGRSLREHHPAIGTLQVVNVEFTAGFKREDLEARRHLPIRLRPASLQASLESRDSSAAVGSCLAFEELNPR